MPVLSLLKLQIKGARSQWSYKHYDILLNNQTQDSQVIFLSSYMFLCSLKRRQIYISFTRIYQSVVYK